MSNRPILQFEREVLRALCSETANRVESPEKVLSRSHEMLRELQDYRWLGDEHRVVYAALVALQPLSGETVAEQLPAQSTRMGFPDVDWKLYLQPAGARQTDIEHMIRALKAESQAQI